ncbi:hypothetical protein DSM104443_02099 [Usitatibacter rugosus]|uniref:IPTL-CTERM protein sorting domain-containing protein n=1 Tax=Usitatibacter rugosus TaxID=2732067 RepID=A0A6M4GVW6_9PROT|nr:hypothetical protein DSM104443_02099 [Usitatibacter rugosus]
MHTQITQRSLCARLLLAVSLLAGSLAASAQVMIVDRGLPNANLNNAAAANRSNFAWADIETLPVTPFLPGDSFTLPAGGPFAVSTIRVWSLSSVGLSLRGGIAGGPIAVVSNTYTATPVTYANAQTYERSIVGGFLPLFQIDFTVNLPLAGGTNYQYFLDGPATPTLPAGDQVGVFLHASNAALSGSPQQGSDGILLFLDNAGTVLTWNAATGAGTYCPGCIGADKVSDGNVQVFAFAGVGAPGTTPVPTLSTPALALLTLLFAGAAFVVMRRRG